MSKKLNRAALGPSWSEVILGAVLSLILGVILGALLLIVRPIVVAKEMPKEPDPKAVYYIEGSRDTAKARQAEAKRRAFVQGQSVTVTEDELNTLAGPATPAPGAPNADKSKAADKAKTKEGEKAAPAAPASDALVAAGTPNVRIAKNVVQVGVPVTFNVLGAAQKVIMQARGNFVKEGSMFVYQPQEMYLGSCPVHRLPFVAGMVRNKVLNNQPIPDDIKAAWMKLANVTVEGKALKLTMP